MRHLNSGFRVEAFRVRLVKGRFRVEGFRVRHLKGGIRVEGVQGATSERRV